jgi:uncharacterized protein YoaH (UPF0181 family)
MPNSEAEPLGNVDVPPSSTDLTQVLDFLDKANEKAGEVDQSQVADYMSDVVVYLRGNKLVGKVIDKWNALSFEEQREAVQADQSVLSRLMSSGSPMPGVNLKELKSNFIKSMLYYGVIEFKHEGTQQEHEALIQELHLNDRDYTKWVKLLLNGISFVAPEAKPVAEIVGKLEVLMEAHEGAAGEVRAAVHKKAMKIMAELPNDAGADEVTPIAA